MLPAIEAHSFSMETKQKKHDYGGALRTQNEAIKLRIIIIIMYKDYYTWA